MGHFLLVFQVGAGLLTHGACNISIRCMQVSNFQGASEPAGEEFISHIVDKLNEQKCLLDVLSIDLPDDGSDPDATETKNVNSDTLAQVLLTFSAGLQPRACQSTGHVWLAGASEHLLFECLWTTHLQVLQQVRHNLRSAQDPVELRTAFRCCSGQKSTLTLTMSVGMPEEL